MTCLLADIGATNARFALLSGCGETLLDASLPCDDHRGPLAAAKAFLRGAPKEWSPDLGAFAVASPLSNGDLVRMTNRDWSFSIAELRQSLGLESLAVLNDFEALAFALPHLNEEEAPFLKLGDSLEAAPRVVLGPGTGLGVASLVPHGQGSSVGWRAVPGEGGHRDLAAATQREWEVIRILIGRFGRASAERALSGPGLVNLHAALRELDGLPGEDLEPVEVAARVASDGQAREAVEIFAAQLGAVAGDLALTLGARGGVFIGGGIVPRLGQAFPTEIFLRRFAAKGRFRAYLEPIPIRLITHEAPALVGLAHRLLG